MVLRKLSSGEILSRRLNAQELAEAERLPVIGMLDNIRSLYNVGSIFRTSDGALVRSLFLCGYTPHPPRPEIDKTALGATQTVPWQHFKNPLDGIREARRQGAKICILEQTTESIPYDTVPRGAFPLCLVVGNELTGITPEVVSEADMAIEIPMYGSKHSLNAAVAYGIALFALARIWKSEEKR